MASLRVILLIENLPFSRDRRAKQEARALREAGYHVTVICPATFGRCTSLHTKVDGFSIYQYKQLWQGTGIGSYVLEYSWALCCSFWLLVWIWATKGFDIIHAANPPDLFFMVALPFKLFKKRFVFDQHDLCPELSEAKFGENKVLGAALRFCERCSYMMADTVLVTNQSGYDLALTRGKKRPDKVHIVRNGPDLRSFQPGEIRLELKEGFKYLALYIGTMAAQDGVDRLLQAADYIVHQRGRRDIMFALLGAGEDLSKLQELTALLALGPYIHFLGWVGDGELLPYLTTADVCLAPDPPLKTNQLSTFIKVMEYMCCAKVTVSFDLLETRRTAGPAALYVPKDDPALFGQAILEILDDSARRERLGRQGLERLKKDLHWGVSRERLLEAYLSMRGERAAVSTLAPGKESSAMLLRDASHHN